MTPTEAAAAVAVSDLISRELDEDYVGLWVLAGHIRAKVGQGDDDRVYLVAKVVLEGLAESAVRVGTLDEASGVFSPWPVRDGIERVLREWASMGRDPNIGEVAWLARER